MSCSCFCLLVSCVSFVLMLAAHGKGATGYWVVFLNDQIDWSACLMKHLFKHDSSLLESLLCVLYMSLVKLVTYGFVPVDSDINCSLV